MILQLFFFFDANSVKYKQLKVKHQSEKYPNSMRD